MAFSISGLVGAGAQEGLDDLLRRQIVQQQIEQRMKEFEVEQANRQQQMDLQRRSIESVDRDREERRAAQQEAAKAQQDRESFEGTARSNMSELINDPAQFEAFGLASGQLTPIDIATLRQRANQETPTQKSSRELSEYEAKKKLDRQYAEPKAPASVSRTWVMRDGKPVRVSEAEIQPGDAPFDAVAARQDKGGEASPYATERAERTVQAVDELIGQVGFMTAGLGSLQANIPGTQARDFAASLDTLKSNIAFNELAQMREASKTGGALGAVSERELQLLQSTLGALDAGQSPSQLKKQLAKVKESVQRWQQAQASAGTDVGDEGAAMVRLMAPNGQVKEVPAAEADRYIAAGAKRVP